jgi:hypothetical protein
MSCANQLAVCQNTVVVVVAVDDVFVVCSVLQTPVLR